MLDTKQFGLVLKQICEEKGLSEKQVLETIESALGAAYRKDFGNKLQNIKVDFDPVTGGTKIYDIKTVVEDLPEDLEEIGEKEGGEGSIAVKNIIDEKASSFVGNSAGEEEERKFNPKNEIQLKDAKEIKKNIKIGDELVVELPEPTADYGRMAAQTAKQVIIQKLREAERMTIFEEFKERVGTVQTGIVSRVEGRTVYITIGKATAILPPQNTVESERYSIGSQIKIYVESATEGSKGPEIILSRRNEEILRELFKMEIPEVADGAVEIKAIAREAGARSKISVFTEDKAIDPIGSCIGQRGGRIQTIINELGGEKVDIIEWSENKERFISNSLSPAKIESLKINDDSRSAVAYVAPDQFSLAIGKGGQNVRLAAKLTGWKIDIKELKVGGEESAAEKKEIEKIEEKEEKSVEKEAGEKEAEEKKTEVKEIKKESKNKEKKEKKREAKGEKKEDK